jgi:Raf kinase inhibitor-like YbhB/YbcL family protein
MRDGGEPMRLHSPAFRDGEAIPRPYTVEGSNLSPPLRWSGVPPQATSLCLVMEDPDAPSGVWVHWLIYNIPANSQGLPAGIGPLPQLADGSLQGRSWGVTRFSRLGYQGPQPPPGPAHRYRFTLHALRQPLHLASGATLPQLQRAMAADQLLAVANLWGTYAASAMVRH